MEWDVDFELTRLHMLLSARLVPGCMERTLAAEDIEDISREIIWEGEKLYVGVMKRMCQPHSDKHMRRYLEVHLNGAEHLRAELKELLAVSNELCRQVFETFEKVLVRVLDRFVKWQERYFWDATDPKDWIDKLGVQKELNISESTFYRKKALGRWKTKLINDVEHYSKKSLYW